MKAIALSVSRKDETAAVLARFGDIKPHVVFVFGSLDWFANDEASKFIKAKFPLAVVAGCSTAGEISGTMVDDGTLSVLAMEFESSNARVAWTQAVALNAAESRSAGLALASGLSQDGLKHVVVFAPGVDLNGSEVIEGLRSGLPESCTLSGGLAGDGGTFSGSVQMSPDGLGARKAVAVGFYGESLDIRCASRGGWKPFGPARKATKSVGNILYELDGESALSVYKRYLGEHAAALPGSGLLFPFETRSSSKELTGLIRTILGIDEAAGSLMLAGSIEEGGYLTLMHASADGLAIGAETAARFLGELGEGKKALLAISCVGRKLVMGARAEEEAEALADIVGSDAAIAGFYSNGEISGVTMLDCALHNQTMTLTSFSETQSPL